MSVGISMIMGDFSMIMGAFSMIMGAFSMIMGAFSMIMGTGEGIETCLAPKKKHGRLESSTFDLMDPWICSSLRMCFFSHRFFFPKHWQR